MILILQIHYDLNKPALLNNAFGSASRPLKRLYKIEDNTSGKPKFIIPCLDS
jgi:hypothetical protein